MISLEIYKTRLDKTKEAITPVNNQPLIRTKDGLSISCNSENQINITLDKHKIRVDLEQGIIDVKDLGLEIISRK